MPTEAIEIEGTWEEILAHSSELAGKRVRLTAYGDSSVTNGGLDNRNREMLQDALELASRKLTPEEIQVLDEFEEFRKQHPVRFRTFPDGWL